MPDDPAAPAAPIENQPNPQDPQGAAPSPTDTGTQGIDTSKFTKEDWDKIYSDENLYKNNPNFKELRDAKKQRDELLAKQKQAEEKALADNNEWKTLAEKREAELNETKAQAQQIRIDSAIERAAHKLGVVDSEAVLKLIDRSNINLDDTGQITGVEDSLKTLLDAKPYLKGEGGTPSMGNPTNPADPNTQGKSFKLSQLNDPVFYREHEAEIREARKNNRIIDDTSAS